MNYKNFLSELQWNLYRDYYWDPFLHSQLDRRKFESLESWGIHTFGVFGAHVDKKSFDGLGFKGFRLRVCKYFVAYRDYAFVAAAAACYICTAIRTGTLQ